MEQGLTYKQGAFDFPSDQPVKKKRNRKRLPHSDARVVSFSGGRSSAMMLRTMQLDGTLLDTDHICFANTGKETEETLRFVQRCAVEWGLNVVWVEFRAAKPFFEIVSFESASRKGEPFAAMIKKRKRLPNVTQRACTGDLKIKAIRRYLRSLGYKGGFDVFLGMRYDEPNRVAKKKAQNNRGKDAEFYKMPLNEKRVTRAQVRQFWDEQPFDLEIADGFGNCDLCFLKGEGNLVWLIRQKPEAVAWWIEQEAAVTATNMARRKRNSQFDKKWSFTDLLNVANNQAFNVELTAFSGQMDCNCGD